MKNFNVIVKVDDDQLHRHRIYPRSTFRSNVAEYDVFELAIMEMPHNITPSSLRRLADVLDRRAGNVTRTDICLGEIDFWRGQYNTQREAVIAIGHELTEAISKYKTRQGLIDFLIGQHDEDQRKIAALRADIAAMQIGEMVI